MTLRESQLTYETFFGNTSRNCVFIALVAIRSFIDKIFNKTIDFISIDIIFHSDIMYFN